MSRLEFGLRKEILEEAIVQQTQRGVRKGPPRTREVYGYNFVEKARRVPQGLLFSSSRNWTTHVTQNSRGELAATRCRQGEGFPVTLCAKHPCHLSPHVSHRAVKAVSTSIWVDGCIKSLQGDVNEEKIFTKGSVRVLTAL